MADARVREARAQDGRGSSTLPSVIANVSFRKISLPGITDARLASLRPASRFETGAWDSRVSRCSTEFPELGGMWFDSHTRNRGGF